MILRSLDMSNATMSQSDEVPSGRSELIAKQAGHNPVRLVGQDCPTYELVDSALFRLRQKFQDSAVQRIARDQRNRHGGDPQHDIQKQIWLNA